MGNIVMNKGTRNALLGFVAGAAAGTITGIFVAPDKGWKTRKRISRSAKKTSKEFSDSIGEKVDEIKDKLNEVVSEMKSKANEAESKLKDKVNAKTKAEKEA